MATAKYWATAEYWAEAVIVREQRTLFSPTLDEMIDQDHEVRLLDETLRLMDWTEWENVYKRERGQPPIHPRVIAALWLYGMMRKMRTSRILVPPWSLCEREMRLAKRTASILQKIPLNCR
jgi:transposase